MNRLASVEHHQIRQRLLTACLLVTTVSSGACAARSGSAQPASHVASVADAAKEDECNAEVPGCHPTGDQVIAAMNAITPNVQACLRHFPPGPLLVCLHFDSSGSVTFVGLSMPGGCEPMSGILVTDPRNACLEPALKSARVPPFKARKFRASFPFLVGIAGREATASSTNSATATCRGKAEQVRDPCAAQDDGSWEWSRCMARIAYLECRYEQAAALYAAAISRCSDDMNACGPGIHAGRAASLLTLGRTEEAIRGYEQAVAMEPTRAGFWSALGTAKARGGRREEACQAYTRALSLGGDAAWIGEQSAKLGCGASQ